jgi:hypothetical protein
MNKLQAEVYNYIKSLGHVSFVELEKAFPEHFNDECKMSLLPSKGVKCKFILWYNMSEEFIDALSWLLDNKHISANWSSLFIYFIDGCTLKLDTPPWEKGVQWVKKSDKEYWLPVTFNLSPIKDRCILGKGA